MVDSDRWPSGPVVPGRYWHRLEDGRVQCDVCPRFCTLHEGQRGLCFVRAREKDAIVLTTYGRSSGFCVDPIEKKPLHHFLPGSAVLSFGTAGCNLSCKFCQNWDISKSRQIDRLSDQASPDVIAQAARELGCESVAFTYNDPTIFFEYAIDVARACHEAGVRTVAVTAGYMCAEPREEFYRHIDAANVDLKAFTEKFYWEITGAHLEARPRHARVPEEADQRLARDHQPRHPRAQRLGRGDRRNEPLGDREPRARYAHALFRLPSGLEDARRAGDTTVHAHAGPRIARAAGVRHAYTGNVDDPAGESTFCHGCGNLLIGRDRYDLTAWNLTEGRCATCSLPLPGVFAEVPGKWGSRRRPVRLKDFAA